MKIRVHCARAPLVAAGLSLALWWAAGCATVPDQSWTDRTPLIHAEPLPVSTTGPQEILQRLEYLGTRWEREPVPVGTNRQVFYDDSSLALRSEHVLRRIARLEKRGPVLVADRPWELGDDRSGVGCYFSVVRSEDGRFRAFYRAGTNVPGYGALRIAYAESEDGIVWEKPVRFPARDNFVLDRAYSAGITYHADSPQGPVYLAAYGNRGIRRAQPGTQLYFSRSEDGVRWRHLTGPRLDDGVRTDTLNSVVWDEYLAAYRIFTRTRALGERSSRQYAFNGFLEDMGGNPVVRRRSVEPIVSLHVGDVKSPREVAASFYSFNAFPFQGYYVANIAMYNSRTETIDFGLAVSRDGRVWDLSWVGPEHVLIERGGPGAPDEFYAYPPATPPIPVGDELFIYYSGSRIDHARRQLLQEGEIRYSILLATARRDGLWYLENAEGRGEVVTKSFVVSGTSLVVNVDAMPYSKRNVAGSLRIELLDADGTTLDGFALDDSIPINANELDFPVQWYSGESLASIQGQQIRIRFVMDGEVRLYAFQVKHDMEQTSGDISRH